MEIKNLQMPELVVANGVAYLGEVSEETNGVIVIKDALPLGRPNEVAEEALDQYLVSAYSGKLTETKISGSSPWSKTPLDENLEVSWQISKLRFEQAIKVAPINLVVDTFLNKKS